MRFKGLIALLALLACLFTGLAFAEEVPNVLNGVTTASGDTGRLGPFQCPLGISVRLWQTGSWNGDTGRIYQYATNVSTEPSYSSQNFASAFDGSEFYALKPSRYIRIVWSNRSTGAIFAHMECNK